MERRAFPPPIGWPLLPVPDARGELAWPGLAESVAQQIRVILSTRPGEQLLRPRFGAGLVNLLHESDTVTTRRRLRDLVVASLERHEPRIVLDRVDVEPAGRETGRRGELRIEIAYRLRRTGAPGRLAVTLDLQAAPGVGVGAGAGEGA
jgi:phage baseplate assembly protein W